MSELPAGWVERCLGDIAGRGQYGWTTKAADEGSVKFLRTTDITRGDVEWERVPYCDESPADLEKYRLRKNDIVISRAGSVGFSKLIDDVAVDAVFASYLIRFTPEEGLEPRYLAHFLRSEQYWEQIRDASAGVALANVNAKKLAAIRVPVAPLPEQKRIADKLDRLLAAVDTCKARLDAIPDILKRFRQSVLAAAVSGALTQECKSGASRRCQTGLDYLLALRRARLQWARDNENHNESRRILRQSDIPPRVAPSSGNLPPGWCWARLKDVCVLIVDCHNKTAPYVAAGTPIIRTSNIRDGKLVWKDMRYVDEQTYRYWSRRCEPEQGDIIFTREAPMGEAAIIPPGSKVCLGQRTMLFRLSKDLISAEFVLLALQDHGFKRRAGELAIGTGVKHLRVGDVGELTIPLPPLKEQLEIVERVTALTRLNELVERRGREVRAKVETINSALLSKAFRGEILGRHAVQGVQGRSLGLYAAERWR